MVDVADKSGVIAKQEYLDPAKIKFAVQEQNSAFWNARITIREEKLIALREGIRDEGLINPLCVRALHNNVRELVCGEQRLRSILYLIENNEICHNLRNGKKAPAREVYGNLACNVLYNCNDIEASRRSIAENAERDDVSDIDLMYYCLTLSEKKDAAGNNIYTTEDIQSIIKRSPTWVSQTKSLFKLSDRAKQMLATGELPRTVALNLLKVNPQLVDQVLDQAEKHAQLAAEQDEERIKILVRNLEEDYEQAENLIAASEALEDKTTLKSARALRNDIDRKLKDAKSRQETTTRRKPRLNADALQAGTDAIAGARQGKSNGISQKILRGMLFDLEQMLEKGDDIVDNKFNATFDKKDLRLVRRILECVTGKRIERDLLSIVAQFNADEGLQPWTDNSLKLVG